MPYWIKVCSKWNLFEQNNDRKHHVKLTPTLGGIAIFAGAMISFLLFAQHLDNNQVKSIIASSLILFFTGFFDDLIEIKPLSKLFKQVLAGAIICYGGTKLDNLYGFLGIYNISEWLQVPLTVLFIVSITNAYNLIDGIDGLAATLGLIAFVSFGVLFYAYGKHDFAILSFCLSGALFGFLIYNFHPAKIFMGDTGSLIIGFFIASQAINLLNTANASSALVVVNNPLLIVALIFIPVFDMIRVSVIRILTGNSPFKPDRSHVHHMIMEQGFGQRMTTIMLAIISIGIIALSFVFQEMNINFFVLLCLCLCVITINSRTMSFAAFVYSRMGGRIYKRSVTA